MFCVGILPYNVNSFRLLSKVMSTYILFLCQMFIIHMCFTFLHLYCSAQLNMSNMEKCYRNKIIDIVIIILLVSMVTCHT